MVVWVYLMLQLLLLLVGVTSHASSNSTVLCSHHERDALLAFKMGFNISEGCGYVSTESWRGSECCKWDGVTCNPRTGHVVELDLSCTSLSGSFSPNTTLFLLPHLRYLSLADNFLYGQVPREIGWLSKLTTLDLSNNEQLKMPDFHTIISNLTNLRVLDLSYVSIDSDLSSFDFNFSKLAYLQLSGCDMEGIIPGWIFTLPSIFELYLDYNQFTAIGQFETDNNSSLALFDADYNRLQGEIPNNIFELHQLQELHLGSNNLSGTIPLSRIHKLQSINMLSLFDNRLSIIDDMVSDSTASWPSFDYLLLSSCNLGHFPRFLRQQVDLKGLELSDNGIHGLVPNWLLEIGNLTYLNLSHNSLSGGLEHLPWQSMLFMDIQYNLFEGVVPVPSPSTSEFWASNNQFTGEIPHSLCNRSELRILDLSQNNLTGRIPDCFATLVSQGAEVLNLRQNQLHGSVPSSLFQYCPYLYILDLSGNKLGGPIPQSITNCLSLNLLDLSSNNFNGAFPRRLEILLDLKVLSLASNKLYGPLKGSNTTRSFKSLQILDVSNNVFTGSLPCDLLQSMSTNVMADNTRSISYMGSYDYHDSITFCFKGITLRIDAIPTSLASIDASRNRLEGPIPDAIGDLTALRWLNLTRNNFSGHIPLSLSKLTLLESLDLSFNRLEGSIPNELVSLASLEVFNVSENHLAGPVPTGKQFDTFSDSSYLGNPGLCGPLLTNKCGKQNDAPPNSTTEGSEDESSGLQVWEIGLIGCGCGMLMGLAWGYLIFWVYSPYWAVRLVFRVETLVNLHQRKRRHNRRR